MLHKQRYQVGFCFKSISFSLKVILPGIRCRYIVNIRFLKINIGKEVIERVHAEFLSPLIGNSVPQE